MKQMAHQQHHLHTGQVPTASQQPQLRGQQLQINAQQQQQQQHTMGHHQQQSHINMTPQQYGMSASHNANVAAQSMKNQPLAQQPQYRIQQSHPSQLQQHQRPEFIQQQQQQQPQYRQGQLQQMPVAGVDAKGALQGRHDPVDMNPLLCVRRGCTNLAITSDDWEDEYCSNECAVSHCREVFNSFHKGGDPEPS